MSDSQDSFNAFLETLQLFDGRLKPMKIIYLIELFD